MCSNQHKLYISIVFGEQKASKYKKNALNVHNVVIKIEKGLWTFINYKTIAPVNLKYLANNFETCLWYKHKQIAYTLGVAERC